MTVLEIHQRRPEKIPLAPRIEFVSPFRGAYRLPGCQPHAVVRRTGPVDSDPHAATIDLPGILVSFLFLILFSVVRPQGSLRPGPSHYIVYDELER